MPSIDLARLRKQALRLADFFFLPDEFVRQLNAVLDTYVNYTIRKRQAVAPGANLPTRRTPPVVLKQIEQELATEAQQPTNTSATLELADRLWEEGWLETRLLAAFLLGCVPPQQVQLVARLTAWTQQVRDVELRARLLGTSLLRMRREAPQEFMYLIGEWLRPERPHLWQNAFKASMDAIADPVFGNLPSLIEVLEPAVKAAPALIQLDLEELILALYAASPTETTYFLRDVLLRSDNPMTAITFRRMSPSFPPDLREEIREFVRGKPLSLP
jgi:DNA alkylation repair enzyme